MVIVLTTVEERKKKTGKAREMYMYSEHVLRVIYLIVKKKEEEEATVIEMSD